MPGRVRTANYPQDARWRLARAIVQAREAAGHKYRTTFIQAAGISKRSLEAAESMEPDAPSVGETVLHAIARALPNWTEDTPRDILEGGLIPPTQQPNTTSKGDDFGPLDEVLEADLDGLKTLARMYAWYEGRRKNRPANASDQERFMLWALQVRAEHAARARGIEPRDGQDRDVS